MTRRRRWVAYLAPPALLAWVATTTVPRAVMLVHHHEGDEHAHVHLFGEAADPEHDHAAAHHHHVHDHDHTAAPVTELEAPDLVHADHVHWQQPYQRVAVARLLTLTVSEAVHRLPPLKPPRRLLPRAVAASARAPPRSPAIADI
jgi:hypothetical protein